MIFFLAFFSWHRGGAEEESSLWALAFTSKGNASYLLYVVLTLFFIWPYSWAVLAFDQNWLKTPPGLAPLLPWRNIPLAALLVLTAMPLFLEAMLCTFYYRGTANPMTFEMRIGLRLHGIALFASLLDLWLQYRSSKGMSAPELEARW